MLHKIVFPDVVFKVSPPPDVKDRALIKLLEKKFSDGLNDAGLHKKTLKNWIEKDRPTLNLPPDANVVRIPIVSILRSNFDPLLKNKLEELEKIRASANAR